MHPERAIAYRKQVSALIEAVLSEEITPRIALNCWPTYANQDPSVHCAYTMLWFLEADEDRHHQELFYADLQLNTLRGANQYLQKGEPLPPAWIHEYRNLLAPPEYSDAWTWRAPLLWLQRQVNLIKAILESNPYLMRLKTKSKKGRP